MNARAQGRQKVCTLADARARLAKARQFLLVAELAEGDRSLRSAAASNLVLAGIAASDAICGARIGRRSGSNDHAAAVDLLASFDRAAAKRLDTLLRVKSRAQYDTADPTAAQLTSARRAATALVEVAAQAIDGSSGA